MICTDSWFISGNLLPTGFQFANFTSSVHILDTAISHSNNRYCCFGACDVSIIQSGGRLMG